MKEKGNCLSIGLGCFWQIVLCDRDAHGGLVVDAFAGLWCLGNDDTGLKRSVIAAGQNARGQMSSANSGFGVLVLETDYDGYSGLQRPRLALAFD